MAAASVAELVGAFGVPHNPHFPDWVRDGAPLAGEVSEMYATVAEALAACKPDALLYITSDHYNLFFETLPVFMIGVAESAVGASDYPTIPRREVRIDSRLARHLQRYLLEHDFDVGALQELTLDHTVIAPLWFIAANWDLPIVPFFINAFLRPLPSARRCFALGRALREAITAYPAGRVAVVASGSFSVEIGGPRIFADAHVGVPAPEWTDRVLELLRAADVETLVRESTDEQLAAAGNAGGEILNWITMLAMFDPRPPATLDVQPAFGHAYASWPLT
jgi:aromatic ring-opening dioxygenase catalytic subunit (LigB family)